jgi:hypothetical protein
MEEELEDGVIGLEDRIRAFNSIRRFAREFNKSTKQTASTHL